MKPKGQGSNDPKDQVVSFLHPKVECMSFFSLVFGAKSLKRREFVMKNKAMYLS